MEGVSNKMVADGLPLTGGRTPEAIAVRLKEHAELASIRLSAEQRQILETFLEIDIDLSSASEIINKFESDYSLDLNGAADTMARRYKEISGKLSSARYRAGFGRRLDYYTGFIFEIFSQNGDKPLAGGGRYDRLMTLLGSQRTIPAVGFSIWIDRLSEGGKA